MAEKLYDVILDSADLNGDEIVYDLYCGAGSISLFLAKKAKFVYGFDIIVSSIENAEQNAMINNIQNIDFKVANLDSFFYTNKSNKSKFGPLGQTYPLCSHFSFDINFGDRLSYSKEKRPSPLLF